MPGICGDSGPGSTEIEVGIGIWNEGDECWVRVTWAMRETEMLLYMTEIALASVDWDKYL